MRPVTGAPILATARGTRFEVGTNRKGATAGVTWSFLLPRLPLDRVAVVGTPERAGYQRLAELASDVLDGLSDDGPLDLVWIAPDGIVSASEFAAVLDRLTSGGLVVDERATPGPDPSHDARHPGLSSTAFRVLRRDGDTIAAIPEGQGDVESWLRRHGLANNGNGGLRARLVRRVEELRGGRGAPGAAAWAGLRLVGRAGMDGPPRYLRDLAAAEGLDIAGHAWGMAAPGSYLTQKVLVPLFAAGSASPDLIVKMTRHPAVNPRLQVELDGLRRLASCGPSINTRVPAVRFAGRHAGMLIVGESAIEGEPFRAPHPEGHPLAADAVGWLTELGIGTATGAEPAEVAAVLDELVGAYLAADGPGRSLAEPLRAQVERVRAHRGSVPVVAQHGDPGTWNLLALEGDRTAFLDWENFEARGMPLWDLFYLLRSLAVGSVPRRPLERRIGLVQRTFLDASELTPFIVTSVRRYCAQVGVADDLIEPMYHLGWMYQALKELTRLRAGHLGDGHYHALLRRGLEGRRTGTLDRIFRGSVP